MSGVHSFNDRLPQDVCSDGYSFSIVWDVLILCTSAINGRLPTSDLRVDVRKEIFWYRYLTNISAEMHTCDFYFFLKCAVLITEYSTITYSHRRIFRVCKTLVFFYFWHMAIKGLVLLALMITTAEKRFPPAWIKDASLAKPRTKPQLFHLLAFFIWRDC